MQRSLRELIHHREPFANPETEAYLNIVLLTQELVAGVSALLKTAKLSTPQYNVLRVLRAAEQEGLMCQEIAERMVHRVPDVTRLLDRLESRGLVSRQRDDMDRRIVRTRITPAGLQLIAPLDEPIASLHQRQFAGLDELRLQHFIELLEDARAALRA